MSASRIEWTGRSDWNPIRGCTRVSEGCRHCYAETIAARFSDPGLAFHGFARRTSAGGRWTGKVELLEDRLTLPLRWRKPSMVFASSTSDVFHESLSDEAIDRIFAVMALAPQHTFQVLTKRAERMREYFAGHVAPRIWRAARELRLPDAAYFAITAADRRTMLPLPNVWLGVSVEDQLTADDRIPHLLASPAAIRFLSCEPLLGPIDLTKVCMGESDFVPEPGGGLDDFNRIRFNIDTLAGVNSFGWQGLNWVIAGGESGRGARPMRPEWARSLRDQCADAGVPFFFKQWGAWTPLEGARDPDTLYLTTKSAAGRLLDGVQHDGMPA